jgi:hypothetical protein
MKEKLQNQNPPPLVIGQRAASPNWNKKEFAFLLDWGANNDKGPPNERSGRAD